MDEASQEKYYAMLLLSILVGGGLLIIFFYMVDNQNFIDSLNDNPFLPNFGNFVLLLVGILILALTGIILLLKILSYN